jgi:hypothetical protein
MNCTGEILTCGSTDILAVDLEGAAFDRFCSGLAGALPHTRFTEPAGDALPKIKDIKGFGEVHMLQVVTYGEAHDEIDSKVIRAKKSRDLIRIDHSLYQRKYHM